MNTSLCFQHTDTGKFKNMFDDSNHNQNIL